MLLSTIVAAAGQSTKTD